MGATLEWQAGTPEIHLRPSAFTDLQEFVKANEGLLQRLLFLFQLCPALAQGGHPAVELLGVGCS